MSRSIVVRPAALFGRLAAVASIAMSATVIAGCAQTGGGSQETDTGDQTTINVFAAASLQSTFTQIADDFEDANPDVHVVLTFGGSSGLVSQIQEGAPADVFASADEANMNKATAAGLVDGDPAVFVRNTLAVVTPSDNPADIAQFSDIGAPGVQLVICAEQVPCGAAARTAAANAGIELTPVSEETQVTDVLGKITAGQADAGVVYRTDALGAGDAVHTVDVPDDVNVTNDYLIGVLKGAAEPDVARAFSDFVRGDQARGVLSGAGFLLP